MTKQWNFINEPGRLIHSLQVDIPRASKVIQGI